MNQNRKEKAEAVDLLGKTFASDEVQSVIVTQNTGMTVASSTALRVSSKAAGVNYKVSKNRLVIRALKGTRFEGIGPMLKGPVGLATSKDPVAAAKVVCEFAKGNDKLVIIGGALGDKVLDQAAVIALSKLPSLDQLRGMLVGLLQTPATRLATLSQAPASQLARVLKAHADKAA